MSTQRCGSLRIALLNTADYAGGAETVVRLLRDGLRRRSHHAELWVGRRRRKGDREYTRQIPCTGAQRAIAQRHARKGFYNLGIPASLAFCESDALLNIDLIHLHNLHGHYFSIADVPRLAERVSLVWTFHDLFPITGGCAFPLDCERWLSRCGSCPQLGSYPISGDLDRTRRLQSIKRRVFRDLAVTIITPSDHLAQAVRRSGVFTRADLRTIPYGVDTCVFRPNREDARKQLEVRSDRPVVMLAAQGLDDPRKGIAHAITALERIEKPKAVVLLVGGGDTGLLAERLLGHDVRRIGYLTNPSEVARCYAAADLFMFTSLAENFPCSVQEAMACGTPVLAFGIDGVTEQITHEDTGFLVPTGNTDTLTRALCGLLGNLPRLADVGVAARKHAETCWGLDTFLQRHESLYRHALRIRLAPPVS